VVQRVFSRRCAMDVLIAEGDEIARAAMLTALGQLGYNPIAAKDGAHALKLLQGANAPRLVLWDWRMPQLAGVDAIRRVRQLQLPHPPYIVLLAASADKDKIGAGLEAGANDYVSKPFDQDELRARIMIGERILMLQGELKTALQRLDHQATHDSLTGILDRRAIVDRLGKEMARVKRETSSLSIGLCDLDYFRRINDVHGYQVGDEVLKGFAEVVSSQLRPYDSLGRYGGEEFLVVVPGCVADHATELFGRLCSTIAAWPLDTQAGKISVTMSVGAASTAGDKSVDDLLGAADAALYSAKQEGRNRVKYQA
jgi:two-component system, cell cycle response regulator